MNTQIDNAVENEVSAIEIACRILLESEAIFVGGGEVVTQLV
jgi:hypothetical protein